MEILSALLLMIDFGMFVLLWIVQLAIYPSFIYYTENNLSVWHKKYMTAISIIVMPLMLSQIALHFYFLYTDYITLRLLAFLAIVIFWIITFVSAVPLHRMIETNKETMAIRRKLVQMNFYRAIIMTAVLVISIWVLLF